MGLPANRWRWAGHSQPQVPHVGVELLAHIHLTGSGGRGAGGVVLKITAQVLGTRQLAPLRRRPGPSSCHHARRQPLESSAKYLVIGAGVDDIFRRVSQKCGGIIAVALSNVVHAF